jgi:hypothetical protein
MGYWDPSGSTGSSSDAACTPGDTRACGIGLCFGVQTCSSAGEFGTWGECDAAPSDAPNGTALCGGAHTECDCGKAGGEVVDIGESCRICRFDAATCPDDFTNYDNWRTTTDGTDCGSATQVQLDTGPGGAEEDCPQYVPAVLASGTYYMLSCDREANYCCGTPPDPLAVQQPKGHPWSSHTPEETSFMQGYNPCGCACGPEHCIVGQLLCAAATTQIGCS